MNDNGEYNWIAVFDDGSTFELEDETAHGMFLEMESTLNYRDYDVSKLASITRLQKG